MKKQLLQFGLFAMLASTIFSCSKSSTETVNVSTPPFQVGATVAPGNISGAIKGTMTTGNTYTATGDILINPGDTLLIQPGVTINMGTSGYNFGVRGTLLSLGTKTQPIWITVPGTSKTDQVGAPMNSDPAYVGKWCGINCDTSCRLVVIKWTHIEYAGAVFTNSMITGNKSGSNSFALFLQNPKTVFVMEDSWVYGSLDDCMRPNCKFSIMRNTFEKCGSPAIGGDVINVKSGGQGDAAYNLIIGGATNGTKASNKGGTNVQTNCRFYNNTYVHCGYKQPAPVGRAGSWNFEEGSRGMAYNGLLVNCRTGLRIVNNPLADTMNLQYGNNFNYGDSQAVYNWIYPPADLTRPQTTDIPAFTPTGYIWGGILPVYSYTGTVGANKPMFVNFPLPVAVNKLIDVQAVGNFDFRLQAGSPCIGKGFTGFSPLAVVPVDPKFGATEITPPGSDIGAYQSNGTGNQHY
jgi:hypothetical protein